MNDDRRIIGIVASVFLLFPALSWAADRPDIRLSGKTAPVVDIVGLSAADLTAIDKLGLQGEAWTGLFAVYVVPAPGKPRGPALLGSYRVSDGVLRFEPRFALVPGVRYRAFFKADRLPGRPAPSEETIERELSLPKPAAKAARVTQVYPTTDRLPENQLKFYVHFSAPMARGGVYRHIKLFEENGKEVELPFLELDEELWDGANQRLTLFCDPGRIKRGLKPREEVGPVLVEGMRYTLVVGTGLEDANGNPLQTPFRKRFRALAPDDSQPDPNRWKVQAPAAGTPDPLTLTFPKPLDRALLDRLLWIADSSGKKVPGNVTVAGDETIWRFTPAAVWPAGRYQLIVDTRLEDLAGNSIARPFEVDVFRPVQREIKTDTVKVPFEIAAPRQR